MVQAIGRVAARRRGSNLPALQGQPDDLPDHIGGWKGVFVKAAIVTAPILILLAFANLLGLVVMFLSWTAHLLAERGSE